MLIRVNSRCRLSSNLWKSRLPVRAVVLLVVTALVGGCASSRERAVVTTPVREVSPGHEAAAAELLAAEHEGDFVLVGSGASMSPLFWRGTAVVVHPTPYFMLRPGNTVVYVNSRGSTVAHVLIEECARGWVVQGLNNPDADDDLVTSRNLVGVVRCAYRAHQPVGALAALDPRDEKISLLH